MREEWVLEYTDYLAAQRLFNKPLLWRKFYLFAMLWLLPALALCFLAFAVFIMYPDHYSWSGFSSYVPIVLVSVLFQFSYRYSLRNGYKRIFLNGDPTRPIYLELDEEKVISGIPGSSEGKFYWSTITRFAENDEIAILYISKRLFLMIPKNKLPAGAWMSMKALIARHVTGNVSC